LAYFGPLYQRADCRVTGFPVFNVGSVGGMAVEVGNAAMLGNWMSWMTWRVSVEKPVTDSLESWTRQVN
jgi:hypothetical protein